MKVHGGKGRKVKIGMKTRMELATKAGGFEGLSCCQRLMDVSLQNHLRYGKGSRKKGFELGHIVSETIHLNQCCDVPHLYNIWTKGK